MYTVLKNVNLKKFALSELPAFTIALILAEAVYKFGSFILECFSFLITWYVISFVIDKLFFRNRE
jgi:hypothetical protein